MPLTNSWVLLLIGIKNQLLSSHKYYVRYCKIISHLIIYILVYHNDFINHRGFLGYKVDIFPYQKYLVYAASLSESKQLVLTLPINCHFLSEDYELRIQGGFTAIYQRVNLIRKVI